MKKNTLGIRLLVKQLLACAFILFSSCYEGWEYDENGMGDSPTGQTPSDKPIYYVLFQPLYPTDLAIATDKCGVDSSFQTYRLAEWQQRISALAASLKELSETFVQQDIQISDCNSLVKISTAALNESPWENDAAPTQDEKERQTLHIVAVFWDADVAITPSAFVLAEHWLAWNNLDIGGRKVKSLRYFILSNEGGGYFSQWKDAGVSPTFVGQSIDSPNPSTAGIEERNNVIVSATKEFSEWVLGESQ